MKELLSTLLLTFATLTGQTQAQEVRTNVESIADTYWRNEATGDWVIGFASRHVIYENGVRDIVARQGRTMPIC